MRGRETVRDQYAAKAARRRRACSIALAPVHTVLRGNLKQKGFPMHTSRVLVPILLFAAAFAATRANAAVFTVTRGDDPTPNGCLANDCSLREALDAATATPDADAIVLGAGQYSVTRGELSVVGEVAIEGAGSASSRIVGAGDFDLLRVTPLSALTIEGVALSSQRAAIEVDSAAAILRDVKVAAGGGVVSGASGNGPANIRIEHSELGDAAGCECGSGAFRAFDSTLNAVLSFNGTGSLELQRVDVVGPATTYGVAFTASGTATISDSTIRNQAAPLVVGGAGADVRVARTRFIGNTGPVRGSRDGTVRMDEVEFRDNVVDDDHLQYPAVLLAEDGTGWRIARALFAGNRGGGGSGPGLIGSTVRALAGANVVMGDVTFYDNTFRPEVVGGVGHAIGVDVADGTPTLFWLLHATMRAGPFVPDNAVASLLAVRGAAASVRVYNSLLHGTCAFASGGAMLQAAGNIEAPNNTCQFPSADNEVGVAAIALFLSPLADNGGFTRTIMPTRYSPAVDAAADVWCGVANGSFAPLDQRRYLRPLDGVACDIGAVETGALADTIFAHGFE
jgi:hypothetical protein